jgi:hypothetical protein
MTNSTFKKFRNTLKSSSNIFTVRSQSVSTVVGSVYRSAAIFFYRDRLRLKNFALLNLQCFTQKEI